MTLKVFLNIEVTKSLLVCFLEFYEVAIFVTRMGRKKQNKANIFKNPNHVVALYDHIPTESDVFNDTEPDYIAPHDTVQLTVKKGEVFEVVGALDWWLYVKSKTLGESGYVPSVLMTPVRLEKLTNDE